MFVKSWQVRKHRSVWSMQLSYIHWTMESRLYQKYEKLIIDSAINMAQKIYLPKEKNNATSKVLIFNEMLVWNSRSKNQCIKYEGNIEPDNLKQEGVQWLIRLWQNRALGNCTQTTKLLRCYWKFNMMCSRSHIDFQEQTPYNQDFDK